MCPVSRNRKKHKIKAVKRTEQIKKDKIRFQNMFLESLRKKQLEEQEKNKQGVIEEIKEENNELSEFQI